MKKKIINIVKITTFLIIGIFLFWLVYKDISVEELADVIEQDIQYRWIFAAVIIGILSHIARAVRWIQLIEPLGKKANYINSFFAIMVGYFVNLAVPRMGEVTRCGVMNRYEEVSFTKLVGTVVLERLIDIIILLLITLGILVTQWNFFINFLNENPEIEEKITIISNYRVVILLLLLMLVLGFSLVLKTKYGDKVKEVVKRFLEGVKSIKKVKNKFLFIVYSLSIWLLYFMSFYCIFLGFNQLRDTNVIVGLTAFVMASFGMVAPVQGGIGAWHFMIIATLTIYLRDMENIDIVSRAFAFISHSFMTIMLIIIGFTSMMLLPIYNKRYKR